MLGFWDLGGSQHVLKFPMCSQNHLPLSHMHCPQLLSSLNLIYLGQYSSFICHMIRMNIWESPKLQKLFLVMGQSKRLVARKIKINKL